MRFNHSYEHWIETFLGYPIDPLRPDPKYICTTDIAHALSNQCRFSGHTKHFYSVAQHSVHVAEIVKSLGGDLDTQILALYHDASEAYLQDMPTPIKRQMPEYRKAEDLMQAVVERAVLPASVYKLGESQRALVKHADTVMLATEARDLMANPDTLNEWKVLRGVIPRLDPVIAVHPERAKEMFLKKHVELLGM